MTADSYNATRMINKIDVGIAKKYDLIIKEIILYSPRKVDNVSLIDVISYHPYLNIETATQLLKETMELEAVVMQKMPTEEKQ